MFVGLFISLFSFSTVSFAMGNNEIQIDSFKLHVRKDASSPAVPIKNAKVNIYGRNTTTNVGFLLGTEISGENGEVENLYYQASQEFDQISFQYFFGNDERGYIIRLTDMKYNANHTRNIPNNRRINTTRVTSISGENGTAEFYVELTKLSNIYDDIYRDQEKALDAASPYIENRHVELKEIDLIYDADLIQSGNSFNRNGKGSITRPVICINTMTGQQWEWDKTSAVAHEWAHWNMYRVNELPGKSYESHSSYNITPETSYKEGWALFQRHRYTCGLENEFINDTQVQSDPNLFGISTNFTVKGALYDVYDDNYGQYAGLEDDPFDIYTLFVDGDHTLEERDLISEGILYTLMVDSQAKTFEEFYQYLYTNYVDTHPDETMKQNLIRSMATNGFDGNGNFIIRK
ncbi:hypothetical protein RV10_GL001031 [Enterococcus pallens]|nr:hypothetical protein RV10_GL001031 [Enterococcus pallens]